jgi:hypothetical protein
MSSVARVDSQGNPLVHVTGCPNCGDGEGWMSQVEYAGAVNAVALYGYRHPDGPCSRACELQIEYARALARERTSS